LLCDLFVERLFSRLQEGKFLPLVVKPGQTVLLPEFGGAKVGLTWLSWFLLGFFLVFGFFCSSICHVM
jgi:hypothetical protein